MKSDDDKDMKYLRQQLDERGGPIPIDPQRVQRLFGGDGGSGGLVMPIRLTEEMAAIYYNSLSPEKRAKIESANHRCAIKNCLIIEKLSVCARCKVVYYCSPYHQRLDWPTHKLVCSAPK